MAAAPERLLSAQDITVPELGDLYGDAPRCDVRCANVRYVDGLEGTPDLEAFLAQPKDGPRRGLILVVHTAIGPQEPFIWDKCIRLAAEGYAAAAVDMFGAGRTVFGADKDRCNAWLKDDRSRTAIRSKAALDALREYGCTGPAGAVGYCLGGRVVLDLARYQPQVADLRAVASMHGILDDPTEIGTSGCYDGPVGAEVAVFHGSADPLVPPSSVDAFVAEMDRKGATWRMTTYGGARHGFTRPDKVAPEDYAAGFGYDAAASEHSWSEMLALFDRHMPRTIE
ncbi:unnamed protein product [Pedinophyceae sp. YPF-701]|nr:unnamed protein product [Pedinophyceae sp. YPF-701]